MVVQVSTFVKQVAYSDTKYYFRPILTTLGLSMINLLKAFGIVLLADFVTGFVHWLEDSYFSLETPILGKWIVEPNLAHHKNGQAFLQKSWWASSWDLLTVSIIIVGVAFALHHLTWEVWLFAGIIANANQIHKWAHMNRYNQPKIITFMQKFYLLQSTRHHALHHRQPNNVHYCTVTNFLNPILDNLRFWRGLEFLVAKFERW